MRPNRPGERPDWANRPHVPDRPGANIGNTINRNNNTVINRPVTRNTNITNVSGNNFNRGVAGHVDNWNQRWNHGLNYAHYPYRSWYHGYWNGNWNNHWGVGPVAWGLGLWGLSSLAYQAGAASFSNPYYVPVPIVEQVPAVNYSQPIQVVVQAPPEDDTPPPPPDDRGMKAFNAAREAFQAGDYAAAERDINQALVRMPNDPVVHEFRALVLFAEKKYKEAAATLESLLAVSPGWDWTTMSSLYSDVDVYQKQLRALEDARDANPKAAYLQFLCAYHYLTMGYPDQAKKALETVVKLEPKDRVASQLLQTLTGPPTAKPPAEPPPGEPVNLDIKGQWTADGANNAKITLSILDDGKFKWSVNTKGKVDAFDGTFTLDNDMLMLERGQGGALLGKVTPISEKSFNFRIVGSPTGDPGLTFKR